MRPPFPGMDPWLENPSLWPDVHNSLIVAIRDALAPLLGPGYFVGIEQRTVLMSPGMEREEAVVDVGVHGGPGNVGGDPGQAAERAGTTVVELLTDVEISEWYLEVRSVEPRRLVTVIELLSPSNKLPGKDRRKYEAKRKAILQSRTNLVEIDLLRAGRPLPLRSPMPPGDYRILVSRSWQRPRADLLHFNVPHPIPAVPIPLRQGEDEPALDLNGVLHALLDRAGYHRLIDYRKPPMPPLREAEVAWAAGVVGRDGG